MKKIVRVTGLTLAGLVFLVACAAAFVQVRGIPHYDAPAMTVKPVVATPERLLQGEHIVRALCADCHLDHSTGAMTGKFLEEIPPEFGRFYSANITQDKAHGIGS